MRYAILTYGCQMNEHDSEVLGGLCEAQGYRNAPVDEADLILVNTCSVRDSAEERVRGKLGELKRLKALNPRLIIGVAGCMAQREGPELLRRHPQVDLVLGPGDLARLPELLRRVREGQPAAALGGLGTAPAADLPRRRGRGAKAWVSISTGCDNACSYCIVPAVRGPLVSRTAAAVLEEVRGLAAAGCREVVLLGQNVDSFGRDRGEEGAFARLLEEVAAVEGVRRVRFTTSHPRDLDLPTLRAMAAHPNICRHLHLPAQSGSDAILARMGRGYTRDRYLDLVARARRLLGDLAVTTDLIVGFPGETEEDFRATLNLVDRARFTGAFTFMFSPRPGTAAAGLPDQVPLDTKKRRLRRLMERVNFWSGQANLALVGRVEEVLAEGPSPRHPGMLAGRTGGNRLVRFPAEGGGAGRMARVEITAARTWTLEGRVVGWE